MRTHTHTDTDICVHTQTHSREVRSTTKHPTLADTHTHTPNKTYGWTDGESDGKTKGGGALSVTLFQRFAFNQLKIEWVGEWMDERKGWGGACSSE